MFDKSEKLFPIKEKYVYLSHCGVSPLYARGVEREIEFAHAHAGGGSLVLHEYNDILEGLRATAARLLDTDPANVSYHRNTSEAMSIIASGYPFEPGDEVISYVHEYPACHYPWLVQERRGVKLVLLSDVHTEGNEHVEGRPCAWSVDELREKITDRTRVVALSHVQFASGYALDLEEVSAICREHGIDLVLDVAQSLGALPVRPEQHGVAACASAGWKWLMGPIATGLMYTSPELREKLQPVMAGAEMMTQGFDYLDHSWTPHTTAKRFEYSTSPPGLVGALEATIADVHLRYSPEEIRDEILRLQDLFLEHLDTEVIAPVRFERRHRSGILALDCLRSDPDELADALLEEGFVCSERGHYLRFAPHFYIEDDDAVRFAETLNRLAHEREPRLAPATRHGKAPRVSEDEGALSRARGH
jgi:selenocysteine lyase/cysteine desulfurase